MASVKQYEPLLKEKYDLPTKKTVIECLTATGEYQMEIPLEEQREAYKARDFIIKHTPSGKSISIECECKAVWEKHGEWQYPLDKGLHIPYRKANSKSDYFCVVNAFYDSILIVKADTLKASPVIEKFTRNKVTGTRTFKEKFFEITLKDNPGVAFYNKVDDTWISSTL